VAISHGFAVTGPASAVVIEAISGGERLQDGKRGFEVGASLFPFQAAKPPQRHN
jgi:hypothetical protein